MSKPFTPPKIKKSEIRSPMKVSEEIMKATVPSQTPALDVGKEEGRFTYRLQFSPEHPSEVTASDLAEILAALGVIIDPIVFKRMPESAKRHFVCLDRYNNVYRYGSTDWSMLQESEK